MTLRFPSLALLVFTSSALLAACGDDTSPSGTGGTGGEGTTGATTTTGSSSPTSSSASTGGQGGEGGAGTGGEGGQGSGGDGGAGAGGGQPAECTLDDLVDDDFTYEAELVADDGHYDCSVEGVDASGPTIETLLTCSRGDVTFAITLSYTPEPALQGEFPLAPGQDVTFDDLSEDSPDPPQSSGYVVRSAPSGKLLFAWVYGSELGPPLADADWADPLTITSVDDLCRPDEDAYQHYALDVALGDAEPVRVFSEQTATLEQAPDTFEVRVSQATYNDQVEGGFNLLYRYAILAPETIAKK